MTVAIFTSVIDVFLGIEMADAGTHRIKIANLCRFCDKNASSKHVCKTLKEKSRLEFQRHGVNVEDDNDFIHPPNVRLRRSIGRGKLPNILESKNQFQQLAVLIYCPEMPSKLGQFSSTPVDIELSLLLNHK